MRLVKFISAEEYFSNYAECTISAFFMFLPQVYKHSKGLFFAITFFIAAQLFINYKHGAVFSPFYHYGMYSGAINVQTTYQVFTIQQNGTVLRGQDFSPQQWDEIMLPVQYYAGINANNQLYKSDIQRLFHKLHIPVSEERFLLVCNYPRFEEWYRQYLAHITGQKTNSVTIYRSLYHYAGNELIPDSSQTMLSQICR